MELLNFVKENYIQMIQALLAVVFSIELITRITPTKKDDSFIERVGSVIRKIADFLKIPNVKK